MKGLVLQNPGTGNNKKTGFAIMRCFRCGEETTDYYHIDHEWVTCFMCSDRLKEKD